MNRVKMAEISSRLGNFSVIKMGEAVIISPCDTRMKIIGALAKREMTSEELARETGVAYSTIMDHMDVLERLGIVVSHLKRNGGRRRIYFKLNENPLELIDQILAKKNIQHL